jgi:hypothetical protein
MLLSRDRLIVDGVWVGNRIYWSRDYTLQITITHRLVFSVTVFTALLVSSFQRQTLPFLWVTELSPASATSSPVLTSNNCDSRLTNRESESESE